MNQVCLRIQLRKFKRVLRRIQNFDQNGSIKDKRKQFFQEKSSARLSQAHYVVEGANLVRNNGSKLFADFFSLSLDFTDSTFFLSNHKYYHIFSMY
jgi:hypothetical protein